MSDLEEEEEEEGEKENEDNCNDGGTLGPQPKRKRKRAHGNSVATKEPNDKKNKSDVQGAVPLYTCVFFFFNLTLFFLMNYLFKAWSCVALCPTLWLHSPSIRRSPHT